MDVFQRGNLTNNQKASKLEAIGFQFKRDVLLQSSIDGAKSGLQNIGDIKMDNKSQDSVINLLNSLIKSWTKEQQEITKKYGQ